MESIHETCNYELFKKINGNRPLNEAHVRRLMLSFQKGYLKTPVYINYKNEVVDGQHRIEAAKRLGLPVYYLKVNGYGLREVQQLNTNSVRWGKLEYLNSYCDLGLEPYIRFKEFMVNYPELGIDSALAIFSSDQTRGKKKTEKGFEYIKTRPFEEGLLKMEDLGKAYEYAGKIMEYKKYFSGYNRRSFVKVMVSLFKNKNFNHEAFINKLEIQPTSMVVCNTTKQYILLIEDIYNYKSRRKVSLRF